MEQVWDEFLHQGEIRGMKIGETRGIRIGEIQGGIRTLVQDNLESGFDKGTVLSKLQRRFSLSPEEAERQYLNYAR